MDALLLERPRRFRCLSASLANRIRQDIWSDLALREVGTLQHGEMADLPGPDDL